MELARIPRERAVDAVYNALRQAILSYGIKPGERLNVYELAQKLGVSLTPVRHAIQHLATEGLIEIKPRSGTFVASLSAQDVEETFDIRCALECLAAEKAPANLTPADLKRLKELLKLLRKPVRNEDDRTAHERQNSEFHQILLNAGGNRRLVEMYEALNAHLKIARIHAGESEWRERLEEEQAEHEAIVEAAERRDPEALRAALRKHIMRARDSMVAVIRAQAPAVEEAAAP